VAGVKSQTNQSAEIKQLTLAWMKDESTIQAFCIACALTALKVTVVF